MSTYPNLVYTDAEKFVYYVPEGAGNYGVTPIGAATNWFLPGVRSNFENGLDRSTVKIVPGGSRDVAFREKGQKKLDFNIDFHMQNNTFLDLVRTLASFSTVAYFTKGGTPDVYLHKGCIIDKATVSTGIDNPITVKTASISQDLVIGTTHPTNQVYPSEPGASPKMWDDSDVVWGTDINLHGALTDWSFTINNNLQRIPVIRSTNGDMLLYLAERARVIAGELTVLYVDSTFMAAIKAMTEADLVITIAGVGTYTLGSVAFDSGRYSSKPPAETVAQRLPFTAKTYAFA
jgi:hypothetical protein